jgi:uncharacterized protein with HEPN domain
MERAADAIGSFVEGRELAEYESDLMLRSAVERQFEILGEAMKRALAIEPEIAERLDDPRGAIDFRNVIAHDYDRLSDRAVWDVATVHLPALRTALVALMAERAATTKQESRA